MAYYVTVQKNPHEDVGPCYNQGDGVNVVELQFNDDGTHAELLERLIGHVVADGKSLDADAREELSETAKRLRDQLPDNDNEECTPDAASE